MEHPSRPDKSLFIVERSQNDPYKASHNNRGTSFCPCSAREAVHPPECIVSTHTCVSPFQTPSLGSSEYILKRRCWELVRHLPVHGKLLVGRWGFVLVVLFVVATVVVAVGFVDIAVVECTVAASVDATPVRSQISSNP
jgi:hypothetical protein